MNFSQIFSGPDAPLVEFVLRFLQDNGALVEKGNPGVNILMPKELAEAMDVEEYIGVVTEATPGTNLYPVHFGSHLLDRALVISGSRPAIAECELKFHYLKKSGFDNLINDQFKFTKSTGRITSVAEFRTGYILMTARYLAQSDEQKEGLVTIALNEETGAFVPELEKLIGNQEKTFPGDSLHAFSKKDVDRLMAFSRPYISEKVAEKTNDFQKSMNRRFARDTRSLEDYYQALTDEMKQSLTRSVLSQQGRSDREGKIALIPQELAIKKKDLLNKYSIKIRTSLSTVLMVRTPAIRIHFHAKSGHRKKDLLMTYNPITKSMDPLVCESCKRSIYRIGFCEHMHLICKNCSDSKCACCD
ncbi:MAG: hypothetical protein KJ737_24570 [Proteobacteria bacterium]|nr:hypothetical protein [Pseudomonadota bacterium]